MKTPFDLSGGQPLLSPLGRQTGWKQRLRSLFDRLPPVAAPLAFTLAGGVAIIALVASLLAGDPAENNAAAPAPSPAETAEPTPPPPAAEPAAFSVAELAAMKVPDPASLTAISPAERTASIPPAMPGGTFVPVVAVAESAAEIEALEAIQREEVADDIGVPSSEETAAIPSADAMPPTVPATTTKWVNMRAGPGDDAEILEVVPALASVDAEAGCDWCAVSYEGRAGYIYKSFLSYD